MLLGQDADIRGQQVVLQALQGSLQTQFGARITADGLRVRVGEGVGTAQVPVQISTRTLDVESARGDIHLDETDGLRIDRLVTDPQTASVVLSSGGTMLLGQDAAVRGNRVTLQALQGALLTEPGALISADVLQVRVGQGVGAATAPVHIATRLLDAQSAAGGIHLVALGDVTLARLVAAAAGASTSLVSLGGCVVVDNGALVSSTTLEIEALAGWLQSGTASTIRADSLTVRTGEGMGHADAPLLLSVDRLTAQSRHGGIYVRESDGLRLSGIGLRVDAEEGDIEVAVQTGDLVIDATAAVVTHGGRIDLAVQRDAFVSRIDAASGAVHVQVGGAIIENADGVASHVVTRGLLTLEARNGIGGFGAAQLRVEAGELRASNARSGNVVIFGERGLWVGESGVSSRSPAGYVVLLSDTGAVETGKVEALSGRIVMMTGYASLTETQVRGIHWMLLQRAFNNPSLAVKGNLPTDRPSMETAALTAVPDTELPLWLESRARTMLEDLKPAQTTRMLTSSALHLLSFSAPSEPGGTETLPQLMIRAPELDVDVDAKLPPAGQSPVAPAGDKVQGAAPEDLPVQPAQAERGDTSMAG